MSNLERLAEHSAIVEAAREVCAKHLFPVYDKDVDAIKPIIVAAVAKVCEPLRIELENNRKWMRGAIDEMCTATFDLKGRNCRGLNDAISVGRKLLTPKEPDHARRND